MSHTHIGAQDWSCVARMLRSRFSFSEIARTLGKHPSAVSRHVREYGGRDGYDVHEVRRAKRMKRIAAMEGIRVVKGTLLRFVVRQLKEHKSPEQISGILALRHTILAASTALETAFAITERQIPQEARDQCTRKSERRSQETAYR